MAFNIEKGKTSLMIQWLRLCASNRGRGFDPWPGNEDPTCTVCRIKQSKDCSIERHNNVTEVEIPVLWPSGANSRLIGKDPDAGKDGRQKEKRVAEDEMVGYHH